VLLAVLTPVVAGAATEWVLKPLIDRSLFDGDSYGWSMPSGHSAGAFSVAFVVGLLLVGGQVSRLPMAARILGSLLVLLVAAAGAVGLVASGYHYATDTVGGACVALFTVLALAFGIDALADRPLSRPRQQPLPPDRRPRQPSLPR
jgi:undecaprenyl-diphosphatase